MFPATRCLLVDTALPAIFRQVEHDTLACKFFSFSGKSPDTDAQVYHRNRLDPEGIGEKKRAKPSFFSRSLFWLLISARRVKFDMPRLLLRRVELQQGYHRNIRVAPL